MPTTPTLRSTAAYLPFLPYGKRPAMTVTPEQIERSIELLCPIGGTYTLVIHHETYQAMTPADIAAIKAAHPDISIVEAL